MNDAVMLAALGIVATVCGALIWIIKYLFEKITPVLNTLVDVTKANTEAIRLAELKNVNDVEFHKEIMKELRANSIEIKRVGDLGAERLMEMKKSKRHQSIQVVDEQTVINQTIK